MAVYKCEQCGHVMEQRCKPGKCKSCEAEKDKLIKQEKK
ncbi:MAG: radical SAM protein [Firmicutes bacterium]|nr:radical SAM protein [Bacillota bacterium]